MFANKDASGELKTAKRDKRPGGSKGPLIKSATPSLVSADLKISGDLTTGGELVVDGTVEGNIRCHRLTVGDGAVVLGNIKAEEIEAYGRVEGQIRANSVNLRNTSHVVGDIWHDSLSIDAGAYLDGHCKRNDAAAQSRAQRLHGLAGAPKRQQLMRPTP